MKISWGRGASLWLVWANVVVAQTSTGTAGDARALAESTLPTGAGSEAAAQAESGITDDGTTGGPERAPAASGLDERTELALNTWAAAQTPGCTVRAIAEVQAGFLLACGEAGLWHVNRGETDAPFSLARVEQRGGPVVGFVQVEGQLLLLVDVRVVQALEGPELHVSAVTPSRQEQPRYPEASRSPAPDWPRGEVVEANGLRVVVDVGREPLLGVGYRVVFRWGERRVIGRVARVWGTQALVLISMHEQAPPPGTPLAPTPERGPSIFATADGDYLVRADLGVRLGLSGDGIFGADAGVDARIGHLSLSGQVRPFAFTTLGSAAAQAFISVGLTTRWFGLNFGGGTTTVNRHEGNPAGTGILLMPALRVGTIDGLHLNARVSTAFHRQEMTFTGLFLDAQIPVARTVAVTVGGGGGSLGLAEGEVGTRILLQGNGGKKSWFLRIAGGATGINQEVTFVSSLAPHLRLGVETRL